jgi:hypothetical protein
MVGINFRAVVGFTDFHIDFCFSSRNTSLILVGGWHLAGLEDRQTEQRRQNPELGDSVRAAFALRCIETNTSRSRTNLKPPTARDVELELPSPL